MTMLTMSVALLQVFFRLHVTLPADIVINTSDPPPSHYKGPVTELSGVICSHTLTTAR